MKRSVIVGVTALVAGLLLAITAFSAPFRSYDRAAGDQYTTPPPACTNTTGNTENNPNCNATTPPRPGCENPNASENNPNCRVAAQSAPTTPPGEVKGAETSGGTPGETDTAPSETGGVERARSGVKGDRAGGAGVSGSGVLGADGAADRSNIAYLFVGGQPDALSPTLIGITGVPAWLAVVLDPDVTALAGSPAAVPAAGDIDGLRRLARRLGADSVPASGISARLPAVSDLFDGAVKPITGLVLARTRIADAGARRSAEAFQRAFAAGALRADIPVVGVELNRSSPSSIAYFKTIKGASSVDDIGTRRGAVSLTRLLAGATPGHYGRQESARSATPPVISADTTSSLQDGGGSLGGSPLLVGILLTMALLGGRALVGVVQRTRTTR